MNLFFVEREAVIKPLVFLELGAMICCQHEDRFAHHTQCVKRLKKEATLLVSTADCLVIDRPPESHIFISQRDASIGQAFFAKDPLLLHRTDNLVFVVVGINESIVVAARRCIVAMNIVALQE